MKMMIRALFLIGILATIAALQAKAQLNELRINGTDTVIFDMQSDQEELEILTGFYKQTNGKSWTNNTNWLKGKTIDDADAWYGIVIEHGDVVEIHLDNNNLTGTIPGDIYKLKRLRDISLTGNNFSAVKSLARVAVAQVTAATSPTPLIRGTNLPVWGLAVKGPHMQEVDWRNISPVPRSLLNSPSSTTAGPSGVAIDDCARLAFYVLHTGQDAPYQLNIYAADGTRLTNDVSGDQKQALNSVNGNVELQVVRVPNTSNQWYIIYSLTPAAKCSLIGSTGYAYCPATVAYARVSYDTDTHALNVIERDQALPTGNTFTQGKAVSPLMYDNAAIGPYHYLYLAQRVAYTASNASTMRISRFKISASGFGVEEVSSASFSMENWALTIQGSSVVLSQDGRTLAVSNRNQDASYKDITVFDVTQFNSPTYSPTLIDIGSLMVSYTASDGSAAKKSIQEMANAEPTYSCFKNLERKLSNIEFSPSGRFLYATNGGYVTSGSASINTYLIQIDLQSGDATPSKDVRIQVQAGVNVLSNCLGDNISGNPNQHSVSLIESAYDGRLYFTKGNSSYLYVVPHPDDPMPQRLDAHDIDLSESGAPNILLADGAQTIYMPESIDGFDYLQENLSVQNFTFSASSVPKGTPVSILPINYRAGVIYLVNWGDGVTQNLSAASTPHTYAGVGQYKVTLTTIDETSCAIKTGKIVEVVPCAAVVDVGIGTAKYMCGIKFSTRKLDNCLTTYAWDFGDGTTSSERNPMHSYGAAGTYTVKLSVTYHCPGGCDGNKSASLSVTYTEPTTLLEQQTINVPTDKRLEVIHTSAATYADAWPLRHTNNVLDNRSSYINSLQGVWRNEGAFVYQKDRSQSTDVNLGKDGTYTLEQFNWEYAYLNAIPGWTKATAITQYSPYSYQLEDKDVLDTYSGNIYDYGGQLVTANGVNMRQDEMAFTSFEYREDVIEAGKEYRDKGVAGNWVMATTQLPDYTVYPIRIAAGNTAVVEASMDQLEDVTDVDVSTIVTYWFFIRDVHSYTRNRIICKRAHPDNPAWSIIVLNTAPFPLVWAGNLRIKNVVSPAVTADLDKTWAHSGKKSIKITTAKSFRQDLLNPDKGKNYYINAWVSVGNPNVGTPTPPAGLGIDVIAYQKNGQQIALSPLKPTGNIIEGWQQIKGSFSFPQNTAYFEIRFNPTSTGAPAWYDDLRFHPEDGNMKAYVYNPGDYRLQAILDEENFATYFYYDREGSLYLTKRETQDGIKTLSENVSYQVEQKIDE